MIFGFLTNLNSNLSPKLEDIFNLSHAWSNLVTSAWFFAYLVFSVPAAKVIEAVGYKRTMVISLFVMVVGALLFVPAAAMISFPFFLTASFVLATGVCGLQTSANPYVSILGPEQSAPARLTLAQAFNSLGTAMAPIVVGVFILTDPAKVKSQAAIAHTVQGPYVAIACALLALGFIIMGMHLPAITGTRDYRPWKDSDAIAGRSIWTYRHTVLAMIGIFLYVGLGDCAGRECHQVLRDARECDRRLPAVRANPSPMRSAVFIRRGSGKRKLSPCWPSAIRWR